MSDHLSLQQDIPAYVASRLSEESRERLEEHLASCRECQELVACCEGIATGIRREMDERWAEHPEPAALRAYGAGDRCDADVARHLETCASCTLEVGAWSGLTPPMESVREGSAWATKAAWGLRSWLDPRPLLAGALIGAAVCAALLLSVRGAGPAPTSQGVGWSGAAPLLLLEEASRNGTTAGTVKVTSDQPYIPLGVRVNLPPAVSDGDRFVFTIHAPGQAASWEQELSVAEIRKEQSRTWVVGFLVPTKGHPPGPYVLKVLPGGDGSEPLMEIPFEIAP